MNNKEKKSTRRGFVERSAAGTAVVAVAGGLSAGCASSKPKAPNHLKRESPLWKDGLQHVEDVQSIQRLQYAYNYYVEAHELHQDYRLFCRQP